MKLAILAGCAAITLAKAAATSKTIIDLDKPAQAIYAAQMLVKLSIGSKPGEIGIRDLPGFGEYEGPHSVALDYRDNLYIDDIVNERIQKWSPDGIFEGVFLNLPKGYFASLPTIDMNGHGFVNVVLPDGRAPSQIWEVVAAKVQHKYPISQPPTISRPQPGAKDITVSQASPGLVETRWVERKSNHGHLITFKSNRKINGFSANRVTPDRIFFSCMVGDQATHYHVNIDGSSGELIHHPKDLLNFTIGSWRLTETANNGSYFAVHYGESEEGQEGAYMAEIYKIVPKPVKSNK
jgi:hypothetical protein